MNLKWLSLKGVKKKDLIIAIILGIIVLVLFFTSSVFTGKATKQVEDNNQSSQNLFNVSANEYCEAMENRLKKVLSSVSGVGEIEVMINVSSSPEIIIYESVNQTMHKSEDGTETVVKDAIIVKNGTLSYPIILIQKCPEIKGVLIVCEGAKNVNIKLNLVNATQVLLNLEANKIEVLEG